MIKIALVLSEKNIIENIFEIFEEHNLNNKSYDSEEYALEEIIVKNKNVDNISLDADAILTRGLLGEILKKNQFELPVVEIQVHAIDLVHSLIECEKKFGGKKIGVIASQSMIIGVEDVSSIINMSVKSYILRPAWNSEELVEKALTDGCEVILGGGSTCAYARSRGILNMLIKTEKESIWQSITEVKRAARISRWEQEKASRFKTLLDYSHEGIISFDNSNRITAINNAAERILKIIANEQLGKKAQDLPISLEFKKIIINNLECKNEIIQSNSSYITVNKAFANLKSSIVGLVVTFEEIKVIQDLESKIRKKVYSRGHIARSTFADITGCSPATIEMIQTGKKFARTNSNVLLTGESGTGKEVLAQSIHNESQRNKGPFVAVNCAALPESLLESELFGYVDGAFTGATKGGKPGLFELAHNGTIFLDEISEMPLKLQAKILRVIQEREIVRLGDEKVIPVDIRIIAATNKRLKSLVENGEFREDLYFRLNVLRIHLPPLRERGEDILLLANHFLNLNFPSLTMNDEAKEILKQNNWRGNIRQLFNICERLAVICEGDIITGTNVLNVLRSDDADTSPLALIPTDKNSNNEECDEKTLIFNALRETKYNRKEASIVLGIDRTTLWRKMKEYNL